MVVLQLVLPALLLAAAGPAGANPAVRVRIAEQVSSVVLRGRGLRVQDQLVRAPQIEAEIVGGELRVAHVASRDPVRVRASGEIAVDGRSWPGDLSLVPRPDGTMDVVNVVPLEPYVERAVAAEIYADWPQESLKAQAVVARTYALHERSRRSREPFHLESSVISQQYTTRPVPARIREAVAATRGEYLAYQNKPILAVFHASAGGHTASAREVWGVALPYLRSLRSPDAAAPNHFWTFEISVTDLVAALLEAGLVLGQAPTIEVVRRSESGRVERLRIGAAELSGRELRQMLGGRAIRSALFEVRVIDDQVNFLGSGSGHGVGLSQWGARELALRGMRYRAILTHYYPGAVRATLSAYNRADVGAADPRLSLR
ncbi:MAG: SpoIID/LytB domain-containing protein [Deltaproteobacteria bacterium]|nr:SpoIID/LytB domain-containing protein [Deltaproteobacteria bacterium]